METLTFKLQEDNFEGPLDLLLYLVGKNKMNLYDVNIMELIEQYTAAIREMQQDRMEISSEFIDMAAHLGGIHLLPLQTSNWLSFALATPVVLWAGWPPSWAAVPVTCTP